ncbi:MAG TPA: DUF6175 family protein [bacterium]|nr:DUF6175 family protein [bacterium]
MRVLITGVFIISLLFMPFIHAQENLPESREAVLVETTSPSEIMVRAKGIGHHDPRGWFRRPDPEVMNERAETDALKSAFYFLLFNADPPILQTSQEQAEFQPFQDTFFEPENLKQYVSWISPNYQSRVRVDKTTIKIEQTFKINKRLLVDDLVRQNIVTAREDIFEQIGLPMIMVLPESSDETSPLDRLADPQYRKGAEVIESYLTSRQYEVLVPEQVQANNSMQQTAAFMSGMDDDFSYQLALSIGSDIYVTYTVNIESRNIGNTRVSKVSAGVRAYETTTARLLGSETGYSEERPGGELPLIEEAMNNAIDQMLGKITAYWKNDLQAGIQYKVIFSLSGGFDGTTAEEITWGISDILKRMTTNYKENVITDQTLDYLVWCSPEQYQRSSDVYRSLKEEYLNAGLPGDLERSAINRKLLLLNIRG